MLFLYYSEGGFLERGEELPPFSPAMPVRAPPYADEEIESERPSSPPLYEVPSYTEVQVSRKNNYCKKDNDDRI